MEVKKGYKQTEVGIIPEDWEVKKLKETAFIYRGASPRPIENPKWFDESSKVGWVRISDVTNSTKYLSITTQRLSEQGMKNSRYVESNNLIMSICATVGRPIITKMNVCIHDGIVVFEKPKINKEFLYYYLSSIEDQWIKKGQIGSQMNLNTTIIQNYQIPLPPLPEQTTIANALSDIDALIASLEKLIAKKRNIKQGAMQQLLTEKKRLPGFSGDGKDKKVYKKTERGIIPEDWELVRLGKIATVKYGKAKPKTLGSVPVIGSAGIYGWTDKPLIGYSTIVVGRKGTAGEVWLIEESCYPADTTFFLQWKIEVNVRYVFNYLKINRLSGENAKTTLPSLQRQELEYFLLPFPPLPEQSAIAEVLSDMDAEIEALGKILDKYKKVKQGMMQELLTGKKRLI